MHTYDVIIFAKLSSRRQCNQEVKTGVMQEPSLDSVRLAPTFHRKSDQLIVPTALFSHEKLCSVSAESCAMQLFGFCVNLYAVSVILEPIQDQQSKPQRSHTCLNFLPPSQRKSVPSSAFSDINVYK